MRAFLVSLSLLAFSFSPSSSFGYQTPVATDSYPTKKVWCATAKNVTQTSTGNECIRKGGFRRDTKAQAQSLFNVLSENDIWCSFTYYKRVWSDTDSCISSGGAVVASGYTLNKGQIWCAHSGGVAATYPVTCNAWGGTAFARKFEAEAEYIGRCVARRGEVFAFSPLAQMSDLSCTYVGGEPYVPGRHTWCVTYYGVKQMSDMSCAYVGGTPYSSFDSAVAGLEQQSIGNSAPGLRKGWCATPNWVRQTSNVFCHASEGKYFSSEKIARNEHQKLKDFSKSGSGSHVTHSDEVWCLSGGKIEKIYQVLCGATMGVAFATLAEAEVQKRVLWCVTPEHMFDLNGFVLKDIVPEIYCSGGKLFYSKAAAEAEYLSLRPGKDLVDQQRENTAYCFDEDSDKYYFGPHRGPWNAGCSPGDLEVSLHEYIQEISVPTLAAEVVWCATASGVSKTIKSDCDGIRGKALPNELQAKYEHSRLKRPDIFGIGDTDNAKSNYVNRIARRPTLVFALAISTDSWGEGSGSTVFQAKEAALQNCRDSYGTDDDCEIVDVNGTWPFIDKVWCNTGSSVVATTRKLCGDWDGRAYSTKSIAERKRNSESLEDASSTAYKMSDKAKANYVAEIGVTKFHNGGGGHVALAVSSDNYWFYRWGGTIPSAKQGALMRCKSETKATCKLMDVDGEWPFIDKVWCVHSGAIATTPRNLCDTWDGTAYSTKSAADWALYSENPIWCGQVKQPVGIRWVWRDKRASCSESGGTVIAENDETNPPSHEVRSWCVSPNGVFWYPIRLCIREGLSHYQQKSLAWIEYERLNNNLASGSVKSVGKITTCYDQLLERTYIPSDGICFSSDTEIKEAYDSMLAGLNDPYVDCVYADDNLNVTSVTEKSSVCESIDGFHTSGNLIWCGKSFKRSCSEKKQSVALQPQTGWCASPWKVRYTSKKNCRRPGEELWPTKSGAQTAHTRLRKEHYEGSNVVVWCATVQSFEKTRITDCESIDGTTWSTQQLARAEHDRLKSASSTELAQVSERIWCATAATASDVWETDKEACYQKGGRVFLSQHLAENESIRRLEAKKEKERKRQEREAIAEKRKQELAEISKREQNLKKLLATKSCRECDLRGVDLRKADLNGAILVKADLQGASLVMASLEGSNLTGANLKEVDLTGTNLAKATLRKADLSQAHVTPRFLNLFPTNLSWADLSEAKLVGANLVGVNFTGAVLTQADLTRANLMNVDLDDADLSGAILIETSLIEANLDHADLTDANLSRANLTDACLDRTNLSRANLSNTFLSKATFRKANLNQVNLQKARLSNADLSGVDLRGADLSGANLTRANLRGTGLEGAQLHGANLYEADLTGADLSRADLEGVNLIRARLRIADLRWSKLSGAELDGAKLVGANLTGADLTRASLNRSDLSRANLTKADLSGADLNRADLSRTALIQAILVGADLYRATLDKADLSQADLTNADLTGVSSQEVIWDQVVLCGTMMQSRVIDDSGCKPDRKNTEPINHRS